jgi:tetratricopeptide (TPR) repeat protein
MRESVLLINPSYAEVWSNIGNIFKELKQYDHAIEHYDQALNLNPDYAKGWFNKGLISHELGLFEEALDFYSRAIKIDPTYHEALTNEGATYHELKQFNDAITHFDKALALKPDYHDASWNKGLSLLVQGDFENGLILYESRFNSESVRTRLLVVDSSKSHDGLVANQLREKLYWYTRSKVLATFFNFCRCCKLVANLGARGPF